MRSSFLRLKPPAHPIDAEITLPGSKSYTNRALIIASLADGKSTLHATSQSDDSRFLIEGLRKLGVRIEETGDTLTIHGTGGQFTPYKGDIDVGPAGTTMRFLTALCCVVEGCEVRLHGSERMHKRPIGALVDALKTLGADITYEGTPGHPPLRIRGHKDGWGTKASMQGHISSQFFTALLLIAPQLPNGLQLQVEGQQISPSYIDMTCEMMEHFDVSVTHEDYRCYHVAPHATYTPTTLHIEGDASGASYFWGLAACSGGRIRVHNASPTSLQGDIQFAHILEKMGCTYRTGVHQGVPWIEVKGPTSCQGVEVDMSSMPDTAQSLAVIASCAKGKTHITGLSTLKHKETDRLVALHQELEKLGIHSTITEESITIEGGTPHKARIDTYEDHRMAMSFAILGAHLEGIEINEPHVVTKSFPDFWQMLQSTGIHVERTGDDT